MGGLNHAFIKAGGMNLDTAFNITVTQNLLADAISTGGALTKSGVGTLTLSGNNSFTGGTSLLGGIINVNHSSALGTGTVAINGGVRLLLGNGMNIANSIVLGPNAGAVGNGLIQVADGNTATVSGPVSITSGASAGGHFATIGTGVLNLTNAITSTTTVSHRAGTTVFSGGGTGYTSINAGAGTIRLGANNGIATTATLNIGASAAASFDLAGFSQSLAGITKGGSSAIIGNSSTTTDSTLTTTGTSGFSGIIQNVIGAGTKRLHLTVSGGTLTLGGSNTYTGATTVTGGTLALGTNNAIANTSPVSIGNATLDAATFGDTLGTLDVTDTANINLGTGAALAFANSSAINWSGGTLTLTGSFVSGSSLRFGTTSGGLTSTQLALVSASGFTNFALNSTGYLTASAVSGYDVWKITHAPTGTPGDDYDGDGVTNGVEYVLGGSATTNDFAKLPQFSTNGGTMTFTFIRDQASIDGSTTLVIETGSDLSTWPSGYVVPAGPVANNPGVTVVKNNPAAGKDTVTLTIPITPVGGEFARLKVIP
jgi:autotransporter-associated beta strand protein